MIQIDQIIKCTRRHCFTWTEDHVLAYLCELASKAKIIVESGTYMGASAHAMLLAAPIESHMWCIDKFMVAGTEFVTRENLGPWITSGQCELIVGDSNRGAEMLQHMTDKVDLIFVDDGHGEEDLRRDILCLFPLLRSGGIMVGHDWEGDNNVSRGVLSMFKPEQIEIPVPRTWKVVKP